MRLVQTAGRVFSVTFVCGGVYGIALARYLFEINPLRFAFLAGPGVLVAAALLTGLAASLLTASLLRAANRLPGWPAPSPLAALALLLPLPGLLSPEVNLLRSQTLLLGSLALFSLLLFTTGPASHVPLLPRSIAQHPERSRTAFRPVPRSVAEWGSEWAASPRLLGFGLWDLGLFLLLFCLYLRTLAPAVGEADPFEFQVSAARLGIAHGNGYPLLMLVGNAFSRLPVGGTVAWRVNLAAAFSAALAAVGVGRLARRLGAAPLTAFLAGFTFGVSPSLWARAVEIEAYGLNAALAALILYLGLELIDQPASAGTPPPRLLYAFAFVFGLAITNHMTTLMLAPACLVAALMAYRRWLIAYRQSPARSSASPLHPLRFGIWGLGFCLLGLSVYLYLPLRWPAVNDGQMLSLQQFIYFLRGGEAAGQLDPLLPLRDPARFGIVARKIVLEYGWAGFGLMLLGLGALAGRRASATQAAGPVLSRVLSRVLSEVEGEVEGGAAGWRPALFLALAYAGHAYFTLAYNPPEPDFSDFFISMHLIAAVLIGLGLQTLLSIAHSRASVSPLPPVTLSREAATTLLFSAFCLLPLRSLWLTFPKVDRSTAWANYRLGQYTLRQPLAYGATILADPRRLAPLYYLQAVEGVRPDLDLVLLPDEASYRALLDERLAAGQTVYLGRYLPGVFEAYSLRSVGPLPEVSPQPREAATPPDVARPLREAVTLAEEIRLIGSRVEMLDDLLLATLYWRAEDQPQANLLVYLRLRGPAGPGLSEAEGQVEWQSAGRVPVDGLYPTNAWRPGEYISDFYAIPLTPDLPPGEHRLEAGLFPPFQPSADSGWAEAARVQVPLPASPPQPPRLWRARLGEQWLLGYAAPESAAPGSRVEVVLYWLRGASETVTAFGETRSIAAWPVGAIVPQVYRLTAPATGDHLDLAVSNGDPARCGWLSPPALSCALPSVRLEGEAIAEGAINFNNQLLLRRATLETPNVTRGEPVEVILEWQGLQSMAESYTVFVHLVGPDGRLYGQVDYWPVQGTRLTSSWRPGEVIADGPYAVPFNADAPPGQYTVHVGLYLLDTLERVLVLNADGAPVDDKVVLSGLTVK